LSESDKALVDSLHTQGVSTCHILGFMLAYKGGHEGLGFCKKDMFFSKFTTTEDGRLENLFWSDSASRIDYECFGDVIAFDTTYKKIIYNNPLVIFSEYNHHGESIIFGCALVSDETTDT
jgi:hypothetical protein